MYAVLLVTPTTDYAIQLYLKQYITGLSPYIDNAYF